MHPQPSAPPDTSPDPAIEPLRALVYVSKAAREVTTTDLLDVLRGARRLNLEERISGVLLCAEGSFMQYLEGPTAGMLRVYSIIKTHPLHYGLIDLMRQPIAAREFADWSMACHLHGEDGNSVLFDDYDALAARLASAVGPRSVARDLLSRFWREGRRGVADALSA